MGPHSLHKNPYHDKMANPLAMENVWLQQQKFEDAHSLYIRLQSGVAPQGGAGAGGDGAVYQRLEALEKENKELRKITDDLRALILTVQASVAGGKPAAAPAKPAPKPAESSDDDFDDEDLFGSDDEETKAIKAKRLEGYAARKAKKPVLVAKSNIILDVKPWDDETDMAQMEKNIRTIEKDGLLWGAAKLVPVGYGIQKLQISVVVEDDKISTDFLEEEITAFEDFVQSVDIAAFNKI